MTNQDRIKTLRKLRNSVDILLTPAEIESLNWAIKVCHKVDSRGKSKPKSYCSWTA